VAEPRDDFWEMHPEPSDEDIADVCHAWVRYYAVEHVGVDDEDQDWWACEAVMDLDGTHPDLEWRVIRCLCATADPADELVLCNIGGGPLEDFLARQGPSAMDLVEPVADRDPVLLEALEGVWRWDEPFRPRLDRYLVERGRTPGRLG
jgi:uncharacterized protein DUF6869